MIHLTLQSMPKSRIVKSLGNWADFTILGKAVVHKRSGLYRKKSWQLDLTIQCKAADHKKSGHWTLRFIMSLL